ncbi:MAG: aminotransferase class III-fold pyridoxal phosphate-dependent enzyme [Euryarchaeota archaeon]|nr:aminotransferase class III-fold pyridoxal phosphate-dependent enzyme [Euryarchaeota archaeon]
MDRETAEPSVDRIPAERAAQWVDHHHRTAAPSTYVYEFVWDLSGPAEGPFCTDVDGNVLLDFTSHVAAAPLGYNNPKVMDRLRAFDLVDPLKIAGQDFYVSSGQEPDDDLLPGPTGLMDRLVEATSEYGMSTVFLSNSGAEAVENAIKIAYDHSDGGQYGITFDGAFHGRTLGTLSLNRSKAVHRRHYPELPSIHDVPFCTDRGCSAETCGCGFFTDAGSQLRQMVDPEEGYLDPDEVAFIILEPVQGEGGYRIPSQAFGDELAAIADEYDITLIADEIQSGLGRTGKMWGSDHYSFEPDVIAAAKALRVGATISREEVFPSETSRLSSTWGAGDILASLQGALTIDAIRDYDLLTNATDRGQQCLERLTDELGNTDVVADIRGLGLMLAVEFDTKARRDAVQKAALQRGLLTLGCGHSVLRLLPPLDVTEREIKLGAELLIKAIDDTR